MKEERSAQHLVHSHSTSPVTPPEIVSPPRSVTFDSPTLTALSQSEAEYGDGSQPLVTSSTSLDLVADSDLYPIERRRLRKYLTPRMGNGGKLWWPVDELGSYLD